MANNSTVDDAGTIYRQYREISQHEIQLREYLVTYYENHADVKSSSRLWIFKEQPHLATINANPIVKHHLKELGMRSIMEFITEQPIRLCLNAQLIKKRKQMAQRLGVSLDGIVGSMRKMPGREIKMYQLLIDYYQKHGDPESNRLIIFNQPEHSGRLERDEQVQSTLNEMGMTLREFTAATNYKHALIKRLRKKRAEMQEQLLNGAFIDQSSESETAAETDEERSSSPPKPQRRKYGQAYRDILDAEVDLRNYLVEYFEKNHDVVISKRVWIFNDPVHLTRLAVDPRVIELLNQLGKESVEKFLECKGTEHCLRGQLSTRKRQILQSKGLYKKEPRPVRKDTGKVVQVGKRRRIESSEATVSVEGSPETLESDVEQMVHPVLHDWFQQRFADIKPRRNSNPIWKSGRDDGLDGLDCASLFEEHAISCLYMKPDWGTGLLVIKFSTLAFAQNNVRDAFYVVLEGDLDSTVRDSLRECIGTHVLRFFDIGTGNPDADNSGLQSDPTFYVIIEGLPVETIDPSQ